MDKRNRKIPISYDRQGVLFKYTWPELEKSGLSDRHQANILFQYGVLSFNPNEREEIEEFEKDELVFLTTLFFRSGLPHSYVLAMLRALDKPYFYSLDDIYWDFKTNKFLKISDTLKDFLDKRAKDFLYVKFRDILSECNSEELNELKEIFDEFIEESIKRILEKDDK